jgi:hypothetical protein
MARGNDLWLGLNQLRKITLADARSRIEVLYVQPLPGDTS